MADIFQFPTAKVQDLFSFEENDQGLTTILNEHPEVRILYKRRHLYPDYLDINGVNPVFHVLVEGIIENQLHDPELPGIRQIYEKLQKEKGFTPHAARASIAQVFLYDLFDVLNEHKPFDKDAFIRRLGLIGQNVGKLGRNDRCPCGSGAKFKRCCAPYAEAFLCSPLAGMLDLGCGFYLSGKPEYIKNPLAPIFQLEARSHIAEYMERFEDLEGALAVLKENIELAKIYEDGEYLKNAWEDYLLLCQNHPTLAAEGLEACVQLLLLAEDDKERGSFLCDKADLLLETSGMEAAQAEYQALFHTFPDYYFGRYRYALMLSLHDRESEARKVLQDLLADNRIDTTTRTEAEDLLESLES